MTVAALEQAITFLSRADLIASARQQTLPTGVTEILKISSGDEAALLSAQENTRYSRVDVKHAAQFYVEQILFAPDSDHYRVLGVDPDDAETKIKLHYRLLVRWLHPDKNSSDWEVVFSDRVNRAWHALRTPERRREYDAQLESRLAYASALPQPSREVTPAQLRQSLNDQRYISSRTIKRLPIAIFGVLGVSAVFALWWLSQLQPQVDAPLVASVETESLKAESTATDVVLEQPATEVPASLPLEAPPLAIETEQEIPPPVDPAIEMARLEAEPVEIPETKPAIRQPIVPPPIQKQAPLPPRTAPVPLVVVAKKPALENKPVAENKPSVSKARAVPVVTNNQANIAKPAETKTRTAIQKPHAAPTVASAEKHEAPATKRSEHVVADPEIHVVNKYDVEIKKLLQRFSRVYEDGNYFALHNLFTKDLSIIGAPPQRKVLHGYRQLFQTSQHREIDIQNVTWLESDEKITVVADYQSQVLPLGGQQAESSRGNIRLVLRMENGELKIIRLQSDSKNG